VAQDESGRPVAAAAIGSDDAMAAYPAEWEHRFALSDGATVFIRPIRPEDERLYERFMAAESQQDLRWRFFAPVKELDPALLVRLTHIDYESAMAFIALNEKTGDMLGVARLHRIDMFAMSGSYFS
jgi:acetyltransferase